MTLEELKAAHHRSFRNKSSIEKSSMCGCFFCGKTCKPSEIKEWVRKDPTALCPNCGIDALVGDDSGLPVTDISFLRSMFDHWFGVGKTPDGEPDQGMSRDW